MSVTDFYMTNNDTVGASVVGNFVMHFSLQVLVTTIVLWIPRRIACDLNQKRHTCEMSCPEQVELNFIWEFTGNILST